MLGAVEIFTNGLEFFQRNIDHAVLTVWKKQRSLARLDVFLNGGPSGRPDAERRTGDVRRNLRVLQRMKLLEFFEAKSEDVVIERSCRAAEQPFEFDVTARRIPVVDGDDTADMLAGLAFDSNRSSVDGDVQPAAVSPAIQRLVSARLAASIQPKKHGPDERHQRALSCFVGTMEDVQSG